MFLSGFSVPSGLGGHRYGGVPQPSLHHGSERFHPPGWSAAGSGRGRQTAGKRGVPVRPHEPAQDIEEGQPTNPRGGLDCPAANLREGLAGATKVFRRSVFSDRGIFLLFSAEIFTKLLLKAFCLEVT